MNLCNGKSKIIKLSDDKNIEPSDFLHNAKSKTEFEPEIKPEFKPELLFEEYIAKRTRK